MNNIFLEPSSYRSKNSSVYIGDNYVFRKVNRIKEEEIKLFINSDFFKKNKNKLIETKILKDEEIKKFELQNFANTNQYLWLQHKKLNQITYPYEWCFEQLKDAAIFHLELNIEAIENNFQLSDATAYNIQFFNQKPIFIDITSFEKLKKNSYWSGYKQFCEQFYGPLLLSSKANLEHFNIYKGNFNGIDLKIISKCLPFTSWFNFRILANIHFHSYLNEKNDSQSHLAIKNKKIRGLSKNAYLNILKGLMNEIKKLKLKNKTYWSNYAKNTSYTNDDILKKKQIVKKFINDNNISSLCDVGCNTGEYSVSAFEAGVKNIVGLDLDGYSLNLSYNNLTKKNFDFTPLYFDIANPTPNLGWRLEERKSFHKRFNSKFDGLICLAVIHHVCIAKNVPEDQFIDFLLSLSKNILLEFIPKKDMMVKNLLKLREDIFHDYNYDKLVDLIEKKAKINFVENLSNSERVLISITKNE